MACRYCDLCLGSLKLRLSHSSDDGARVNHGDPKRFADFTLSLQEMLLVQRHKGFDSSYHCSSDNRRIFQFDLLR